MDLCVVVSCKHGLLVYAMLELWLCGLNGKRTVCFVDRKVLWILGFTNSVKMCCFISRVTADVDSYIVSFCSIYIPIVFFLAVPTTGSENEMHEQTLCKDVNLKSHALSELNNSCGNVTNIHASTGPLSLPNLLRVLFSCVWRYNREGKCAVRLSREVCASCCNTIVCP